MSVSTNNMVTLAHLNVTNSTCHIYISMCMTSRNIHIFKYNDHCCDYMVFDDQELACQFINQPLPGDR